MPGAARLRVTEAGVRRGTPLTTSAFRRATVHADRLTLYEFTGCCSC